MVKCVVASLIEDLRYCLLQAHVVLDGLDAADSARNLNRPAFGSLRGQKAASLNHAHERRGVDFGGLSAGSLRTVALNGVVMTVSSAYSPVPSCFAD